MALGVPPLLPPAHYLYQYSTCLLYTSTGDEISFTYYKEQKGDLVIDEYHCPRAEQRLQAWTDAQSDETLQKAGLKRG